MSLSVSVLAIVLVFMITSTRLCVAQVRIVINPSSRTVVLEGRDAFLNCGVQGLPSSGSVYWERFPSGNITRGTNDDPTDGFEIIFSATHTYHSYDLKITSASAKGDRSYECVADDGLPGGNLVRSSRAQLDVIVPQSTQYPQCFLSPKQTITEGDYATAVCASGDPENILSWNKNGHALASTVFQMDTYYAAEYKFLVTYEDRDMKLKCFSSLNNQTCAVQQVVQYKPRVTIEPTGREYPQEDTAKFTCVVDAQPDDVAYRWEYGGIEIDQGYFHHRFNHFEFEEEGRVLIIPNLMLEDNRVMVMCEAVSVLGSDSATATLYVRSSTLTMETIGPILVGCICVILIVILLSWMLWYFCCNYRGGRQRRRRPPPDMANDLPGLRTSDGYGPDSNYILHERRYRGRRDLNLEAYDNVTELDTTELPSSEIQHANDTKTPTARDNPYSTPPSQRKSFKNLDLDDDDVGMHSGSYDVNPDPGLTMDSTQTSTFALSDKDSTAQAQNGK